MCWRPSPTEPGGEGPVVGGMNLRARRAAAYRDDRVDVGVDPRANWRAVSESEWFAAWHAARIPYRPPRPTEREHR